MRDFIKKTPRLYFYRWLLWWFQPIYKFMFKFRAEGLEFVPEDGPFLLIGNHSHKLDPFFIGGLIRKPIFQLASDEFFRIPLMRRFMWAMGAFPFSKSGVDMRAMRYAISLVRRGHTLAIYPERGRNWDGQTRPVLKATAGMVKILNIPVVAAVSECNYIAWPRWANRARKCPITVHFSEPVVFDKKATKEEIVAWMQRAIDHNDNDSEPEWIRGKRPAEGLTRLLWRCPACRALEGLVERRGERLWCSSCGKEWEVNLACRMREAGMETWKTIKEYADLMFREEEIVPLEGSFGGLLEEGEQVFLESSRVTLYKQPKYPKLKKIDDGKLLLTDRGLVFMKNRDGRGMRFRFNDIVGESTEKNYIFQIALKPDLEKPGDEGIRRFEMKHESCLKWELLFNHVQDRSRTARE